MQGLFPGQCNAYIKQGQGAVMLEICNEKQLRNCRNKIKNLLWDRIFGKQHPKPIPQHILFIDISGLLNSIFLKYKTYNGRTKGKSIFTATIYDQSNNRNLHQLIKLLSLICIEFKGLYWVKVRKINWFKNLGGLMLHKIVQVKEKSILAELEKIKSMLHTKLEKQSQIILTKTLLKYPMTEEHRNIV